MNEDLARTLARFLLQCEQLGIVTVNRDRLGEVDRGGKAKQDHT